MTARPNPRQFDMFAAPPPPPVKPKRVPEDWATFRARFEAAEGRDHFETLGFGDLERRKSWATLRYRLVLWHDVAGPVPGWRTKRELQVHNSGSSGPFGIHVWPTRDAAVLDAFRSIMADLAHNEAMADAWEDNANRARDLRKLFAWCQGEMPPLLCGVDLEDELNVMRAAEREQEGRRRAMLHRVQAIHEAAAVAIWREGEGPYTGPDRSGRRTIMDHADGLDWQDRFVGEYHVAGAMPNQLEVVIYAHRSNSVRATMAEPTPLPILEQARERIAAGVDVPVRLARDEEHALCWSDRGKVTW